MADEAQPSKQRRKRRKKVVQETQGPVNVTITFRNGSEASFSCALYHLGESFSRFIAYTAQGQSQRVINMADVASLDVISPPYMNCELGAQGQPQQQPRIQPPQGFPGPQPTQAPPQGPQHYVNPLVAQMKRRAGMDANGMPISEVTSDEGGAAVVNAGFLNM